MRHTLAAALCAILCAGPAFALAQDEDDWEFQHEPSLNQMVAAVRYDAGVAIVVQCRDNALSAALIGMPVGVGGIEVQARRADGRTDTQSWVPGPQPGVLLSAVPARDMRFMRGGGLYTLRTAEGAPRALRTSFDLPTQSANLDRVLSACGWGLTDDRDQLPRAGREVSFVDPDAPDPRGPRSSGGRPRAGGGGRPSRPEPPSSAQPVLLPAEGQISCIIRGMRLTECRADHPANAARGGPGADFIRFMERRPLFGVDPAAAEGTVVYQTLRTVTVVDYLRTSPAG